MQRLITSLGIRFGEMNIEIILDKQDNVHFLELGPRAGGNMIPIQLSDAFGVDLVKANVQAAMGETIELTPKEKEGCFMTYVLHSYKDGVFQSVDYAKEIKDNIYREVIYKQAGEKIEYFDGAGKAIGIVFLHFDTYEQMIKASEDMENLISIKLLETSRGGENLEYYNLQKLAA